LVSFSLRSRFKQRNNKRKKEKRKEEEEEEKNPVGAGGSRL
jgi:hypothetical protein